MFNAAGFAERFAGVADSAAVKDDAVTELGRGFGRENFTEFPLDLFGLFEVIHKAEAVGDADAVGIHHSAAGNMKDITEDQVSRFAADAWERNQLLHGRGHLPVVFFQKDFGTFDNVSRLGAEKTAGMNILLDFAHIRFSKSFQTRETGIERRCNLIDTLVGALGSKTDGEKQFVGFGIV